MSAYRAIFAVRIGRVKSGATLVLLPLLFAALACGSAPPPGVYSPDSSHPTTFQLQSLKGVRDGDRLSATAVYSDAAGALLTLDLELRVGVPTILRQGTYRLGAESGEVRARSVTFLGGQSDWPNLGGSFELLKQGQLRYLVRLGPTPVDPTPPGSQDRHMPRPRGSQP